MKRFRMLKFLLLAALLGIAAGASAQATTANGGTVTVTRGSVVVSPDGTTQVFLVYSSASGAQIHSRLLTIPPDRSKIVDQFGTVIATPSPSALNTAIANFATALDSAITTGAGAGKLDL